MPHLDPHRTMEVPVSLLAAMLKANGGSFVFSDRELADLSGNVQISSWRDGTNFILKLDED